MFQKTIGLVARRGALLLALGACGAVVTAQNVAFNPNAVGQARTVNSPLPQFPPAFNYGAPVLRAAYCTANGPELTLAVYGLPFDYNTVFGHTIIFALADGSSAAPGVPALGADVYLPAGAAFSTIDGGPSIVAGGSLPTGCAAYLDPGQSVTTSPVSILGPVGQAVTVPVAVPPAGLSFPLTAQAFIFRPILGGRLYQSNAINFTVF